MDVEALTKRLREDADGLRKISHNALYAAGLAVRVKNPPALIADLDEAADALAALSAEHLHDAEYAALAAEVERLREALKSVLDACDQGRMVERGVGGMTIEAQIRRSVINGVPAWPIEEARAALEGKDNG